MPSMREAIPLAFAVFNDFSDSFVMISQDNGFTWKSNCSLTFLSIYMK